jgi:hypothetical protein
MASFIARPFEVYMGDSLFMYRQVTPSNSSIILDFLIFSGHIPEYGFGKIKAL